MVRLRCSACRSWPGSFRLSAPAPDAGTFLSRRENLRRQSQEQPPNKAHVQLKRAPIETSRNYREEFLTGFHCISHAPITLPHADHNYLSGCFVLVPTHSALKRLINTTSFGCSPSRSGRRTRDLSIAGCCDKKWEPAIVLHPPIGFLSRIVAAAPRHVCGARSRSASCGGL